jgi:MoxR-like ATPase
MIQDWHLFTGRAEPHDASLPPPPPWREFSGPGGAPVPAIAAQPVADDAYWARARAYRTPPEILDAVNAALALRRPLLVTGKPGTGKSSLIYRVAFELQLGSVLVWPVNSRSTLKEGLYDYDAIARLQDRQIDNGQCGAAEDIGRYIALRALGTALLPQERPRALLIDELDKADPDLPNDLLNVFEEGWYDIPELQRHTEPQVSVRFTNPLRQHDQEPSIVVDRGRVQCRAFPFIVLTSNGEREFPPAFLRRCIRVELPDPDESQLTAIVRAHLGDAVAEKSADRIREFAGGAGGSKATDQLLNALYIVHGLNGIDSDAKAAAKVDAILTQPLT